MAKRDSPRRVTQHQLGFAEPDLGPALPENRPANETSSRPDATKPPLAREPSDLKLRDRRRRWLEERERFERSRDSSGASSSSK